MSARERAALDYAARGWPVFPLHTGPGCSCGRQCDSPAKHPRIRHGLTEATTDPAMVARWWEMWPEANVGVRTGAESGIFVIDVDPDHAGSESLARLEREHGPLPATVEAITGGGGRHVVFRYPGTPVRSRVALVEGIDVRGDGGYIVAEPSVHASGTTYLWGLTAHPEDTALADAPSWLLAMLNGDGRRHPASRLPESIPAGQRNAALTSAAGTMRRRGMSEPAIAAALLEENRSRCSPPLPEDEVRKVAASIRRYEPASVREPPAEAASTWDPIDLAPVLAGGAVEAEPAIGARSDGRCLFYLGKVNDIHGEPEGGKTLLALAAAAEVIRQGETVLYLDFEDHEAGTVERLRALGVREDAILSRFRYIRPDEPLAGPVAERFWRMANAMLPSLIVIDGVTEFYVAHGFEVKDTVDAAKAMALLPRPLAALGGAVVTIDHVPKDGDRRFALGAGHKLAGLDGASYHLEVVRRFGRGRSGLVKVSVSKDRPGHVRAFAAGGKVAAEMHVEAEDGLRIELHPPQGGEEFRPTVLMLRVSRFLEDGEPRSQRAVSELVTGKADHVRAALRRLVVEGFVERTDTSNGAEYRSVRPFADEAPKGGVS